MRLSGNVLNKKKVERINLYDFLTYLSYENAQSKFVNYSDK